MTDDPRDPRLQLARRLLRRERTAPKLAGPRSAGDRDTSHPTWNLPTGNDGDVLTLVDVAGDLIPQFEPPASSGALDVTDATTTVTAPDTLKFDPADFDVAESPSGTALVTFIGGVGSTGVSWIDDNEQPQEYPGSPSSVDDEFSDSSLDAAWTITNNPSGGNAVSESRHAGFLHVGLPENPTLFNDVFDAGVRVWRTPPGGAATATYIARVALAVPVDGNASDGGEFAAVHVYLGNSVNDEAIGAGIQVNIGSLSTPMGSNMMTISPGGSGAIGGTGSLIVTITPGEFVFVKLEKTTANAYTSANTYKCYVSGSGIIWHLVGSASFTFTTACNEFGIFFRTPKPGGDLTPTAEALVDFVRKTA